MTVMQKLAQNLAEVPAQMKAVVHRQYGEPDKLALAERSVPSPGPNEVLVQIRAAGVSIGDHHVITGKPYLVRLSPFGGFPRPKHSVPGALMAGVVAAVGSEVTDFHVGDEVYGQSLNGAFAEYAVVPAKLITRKPASLSFEQAAAVPWGTTALQGLRDAGEVKPGQRVLIIGASGAVGTWAVQIAKSLGATVTAVCSARNAELVRELGADEIIDYTTADYTSGGARFDVVFDLIGTRSLTALKGVLVKGGNYVAGAVGNGNWVGPILRLLAGFIVFAFGGRKFKMFVQQLDRKDLEVMSELVSSGKCRPVVDKTYVMKDVAEALTYVGAGHTRGSTVLRMGQD